jgi:membrane-bound lytic murein transglycosylase D
MADCYSRAMRIVGLLVILLLSGSVGPSQEDTVTLDSLVQSAGDWAKENLDDDVLRALDNVDQEKVRKVILDIQKELRGQYVIDLASLKQTAKAILPILDRYEETQPYAAWLRTQLDYLEVADRLRLANPPPKAEPGKPPKPAPNPPPQQEREVWIQRLADRPWPDRAKAYVPLLKPIFAAQKVPPELIWIAEVESSFDPRARSPAGAAGLFQLMPVTAKRFGLAQRPLDQRLEPEESARAAAKYLGLLHEQFKDWRLALAAYNAGEGTVQSLLARQKAGSFDAIATRLPAETQMYVPRIEATLLRREGIKLRQL